MVDDEPNTRGASKALALISRGAVAFPAAAPSTRNAYHRGLRSFVDWCEARGLQAIPAVGVEAFKPSYILDGSAEVLRRDLVRSHSSRRQPVPIACR